MEPSAPTPASATPALDAVAAMAERRTLDACFLGPYGENDTLLEKLVVEFLRDHVHWRRNFHPEDPPAISTLAAQHPAYQAFEARMRRELHQLSAALKQSVPFHSPRYIGHMASDLLLPGLAAQILTLPYNPNNVSEDAAPITVQLEVQAGLQLARMLGYPDDPARPDCAFGHLTSGGTVANYQALRLALALKAFPVALCAAGVADELDLPDDGWQAFNLGPAAGIALLQRWQHWLAAQPPAQRQRWRERVEGQRIEQLGLVEFFARHRTLRVPQVLAPVTAHYSWSKGLKLLGLGRGQLRLLPVRGMRMDADALEQALEECARERQPVLMAVAVLGSTEYGTIDPVHAVVAARDRAQARGLGLSVHVDAAWGGYLTTLFRRPDGGLRTLQDVRADYGQFPQPEVHAAFAALAQTDSVTVDPHKLGYLPYGAGAFICRDHRAMALLSEQADYVFRDGGDDYMARYRQLGQFIPEGSRSGATAAAVYVTHKVLPLDHAHFGLMPRQTVLAAEAFQVRARRFAVQMAPGLQVSVPFAPDSNLVCLALNPRGNRDLATANAFVRRLYGDLRCDPRQPLQMRSFFASITTLQRSMAGEAEMQRVLGELDIDPATMDEGDADRLVILRHTLMNPYLIDHDNGISYIDRYFDYLAGHLASQGGG